MGLCQKIWALFFLTCTASAVAFASAPINDECGDRARPMGKNGRLVTCIVIRLDSRVRALQSLKDNLKKFVAQNPDKKDNRFVVGIQGAIKTYEDSQRSDEAAKVALKNLNPKNMSKTQIKSLVELMDNQEKSYANLMNQVQKLESELVEAQDDIGKRLKETLLNDLLELLRVPYYNMKAYLKLKINELKDYLNSDLDPPANDPIAKLINKDEQEKKEATKKVLRQLEGHAERIEVSETLAESREIEDLLDNRGNRSEKNQLRRMMEKTVALFSNPKTLEPTVKQNCAPEPIPPPFSPSKLLNFERADPLYCSLQFENSFAKMSAPAFVQTKDGVSRNCIIASMKSYPPTGVRYVSCPGAVPNSKRPCITDAYVTNIHSAFTQVTSCLDINQNEFLPILAHESGLHMNVRGPSTDIGIGQLTGPAIQDANEHFERFQDTAKTAKGNCAQLATIKKQQASSDLCGLVSAPENPLRNLFYAGIVAKRNKEIINSLMKRMKIGELLDQNRLGAYRGNLDKILETLGYNAGAPTAVVLLQRYLKGRLAANAPINKSLFNFGQDARENTNVGKSCDLANPAKLTFAQYVRLCQPVGTKGYVNRVYLEKEKLERWTSPQDKCTPQKFLEL